MTNAAEAEAKLNVAITNLAMAYDSILKARRTWHDWVDREGRGSGALRQAMVRRGGVQASAVHPHPDRLACERWKTMLVPRIGWSEATIAQADRAARGAFASLQIG